MTGVGEQIRGHFRSAFNLSDEAIERLTETSRMALFEGLAALRASLDASDAFGAGRWAHSVKGTLLNAGLARMAEEVGGLEQALAHGEAGQARGRLDVLEDGLKAFLNGH